MKKVQKNYFRSIFMMILMSLTLISCGQDNKSGDSSSSNNTGFITGFGVGGAIGGFNYSGISSVNGIALPSNWLAVIAQENFCNVPNIGFNGVATTERVRIVVPLTGFNINAGAVFVGVTVEGDIGIISLQAQGPVMELLACQRPDLTSSAIPTGGNIVTNVSRECPVSEITAATIAVQSSQASQFFQNYTFLFAPIHVRGTQRFSSLCI